MRHLRVGSICATIYPMGYNDFDASLDMPRRVLLAGVLALLLCVAPAASAAAAGAVTVYAAASLTEALQEIADRYAKVTGVAVKLSFAASSSLARQIEAGSRAEVFFPADQQWMDYLEQRNLLQAGSRHDVVGNRLVLIAPADSRLALRIGPKFPLRAALGTERLATGDPDVVPVGRYARAALLSLGVWDDVADRLVRAENVRSALTFVARAEVPLGIVYATDARVDPKVRVVDVFPASSHPPITYPIALTREASPPAAAFVGYLRGQEGRAVFEKFGFIVLP
jgi:molybdate transport system substrate-binding protein